jgi:hypothetical protein
MSGRGTPSDDAARLLAALPDCFDEWVSGVSGSVDPSGRVWPAVRSQRPVRRKPECSRSRFNSCRNVAANTTGRGRDLKKARPAAANSEEQTGPLSWIRGRGGSAAACTKSRLI